MSLPIHVYFNSLGHSLIFDITLINNTVCQQTNSGRS